MSIDYLNNGSTELKENLTMTGMFLALLIFSAIDTDLIAFVILFILLFALFWLKPTIAILNENADHFDMRSFILMPIIGLLRIYWKPYQRMAEKLMNEEAFKKCEKALELMKDCVEIGWPQFCQNFPKIEVSDETRKRRYELVKLALQYCVANGIREAKNELRKRKNTIMQWTFFFKRPPMADFIHDELINEITKNGFYLNSEITNDAFGTEIRKRTSVFVKLQKELHKSGGNSTSVFSDLCKILDEARK